MGEFPVDEHGDVDPALALACYRDRIRELEAECVDRHKWRERAETAEAECESHKQAAIRASEAFREECRAVARLEAELAEAESQRDDYWDRLLCAERAEGSLARQVDDYGGRLRDAQAENAMLREENDKWLRQAAFEHRLCVMRQVSLAPHNYEAVERDYVRGWADDETAERLYPLDAKRGTHG